MTNLKHLSDGRVEDEWGNQYIEQDRPTTDTPMGTCSLSTTLHLETSVCVGFVATTTVGEQRKRRSL
jgi:hypothetical protein